MNLSAHKKTRSTIFQNEETQRLLREWHSLHPEFTDEEFEEAIEEICAYVRLAWTVFRQKYPDLDLPDTL